MNPGMRVICIILNIGVGEGLSPSTPAGMEIAIIIAIGIISNSFYYSYCYY